MNLHTDDAKVHGRRLRKSLSVILLCSSHLLATPVQQATPTPVPAPVRSASLRAFQDGANVVVIVGNKREVRLDAWDLSIRVSTTSQPTQTIRLRHDFYRSIALGDVVGQNAIQPFEVREDRVQVPGLTSVLGADLTMLIFRDGKSEGDPVSRDELVDRRRGDAVELAYWNKVLRELDLTSLVEARATLHAKVVSRESALPSRDTDQAFAKSLRTAIAAVAAQADADLASGVAHLLDVWSREEQAAKAIVK